MMIAHVYLKKGCIVPMHEHHNEQLTYVLFLKMVHEQTRPPFKRAPIVPEPYDWPRTLPPLQ